MKQQRFTFRLLAFIFLFLTATFPLTAQVVRPDSTSKWKKAFKVGLNINQASFSSNWKAGGVNSIGLNTFLNYKANYKNEGVSWDNEIDLLYGFVNNQGQGQRKTLDRIFLDTKYGRSLSSKWDMFLSANLQTQFSKGYKYEKDAAGLEQSTLISDFAAPIFITTAYGFEYHPAAYFKVRFAPFAPRVTIVSDGQRFVTPTNPTPFGVDPSKTARYEWLAFQMLAEFNKDIAENINLKWRYIMFANYETLEGKKIDHRFDLNLTAKVNKFVNVNLGGILLYDYDQDTSVQLSQAFSLGVLYTFQNFVEKK